MRPVRHRGSDLPVGKVVDHGREIYFPSGMEEMGPVTRNCTTRLPESDGRDPGLEGLDPQDCIIDGIKQNVPEKLPRDHAAVSCGFLRDETAAQPVEPIK